MLRSTRTIASLIHHLMLGTATVVATGTLLTTSVGCKDEGKPDYWVDKLEDRAWRPRAVKRLEQFFEDALTKANKDASAPEVKALLDKIAEPLTKAYVQYYDDYDSKTRVSLIKLLSAFRDPRTVPALKKAFEEFVKRPPTNKDDSDVKWAARGAGALKEASLAEPMIQSFMKLKASTMLGGITYKDFNDALQEMPQPSWAGPLRSMLDAPIAIPKSAADKDKLDPYKDQLFWQNDVRTFARHAEGSSRRRATHEGDARSGEGRRAGHGIARARQDRTPRRERSGEAPPRRERQAEGLRFDQSQGSQRQRQDARRRAVHPHRGSRHWHDWPRRRPRAHDRGAQGRQG
ncbi:MAG: hypothetical protein QM784_16995 [Polyangiaceae bacterium]